MDGSGEVEYNTDPIMTVAAEEDVRYEASFVSGYIVSATAYPDLNSGTIEYNPDYPGGETEENTIRESFKPGTNLTLTAVPTAGNAFDHWEIDAENVGMSPWYESILESDIDITAVFTPGKTLTMTVSPGEQAGAIEVDPDLPGGAQNGAVRTECYLTGRSVTVIAAPEVGYLFDHWEGDDIHNSTNDTETLTLSTDKSITAHFIEGKVLTVEIVGEGEVNPEEGQHTYATNTVVTGITATPADGWWFDHWEEDLSGSDSRTSITLDTDKTIRAVFKTNFTLTMAVSGSGTVTPSAGTYTKESGDVVALNAVPDTGWWFHHWECEGDSIHGTKSASTNLTMNGNKEVTAVFVFKHTLTMAVNGEGSVTPTVGQHDYGHNDVVSVSAAPASEWRFDHWEGDLTGNTNPANITMDGDKSVIAVFVQQHTLTISQEGSGTVTPAAGTYAIDHGEVVTLVAGPNDEWVFDHWEGDEQGLNASLSFDMTSDKNVTAVFRQEFDVTFATQGSGRLNPAVGTHIYRTNDQIPVAAFPDASWRFDHWDGGLTGSENPTTLTVTAETTVTGVFVKLYRIRTATQGMGSVELTPDGLCFDTGTTLQIGATADSGWQFDHWECAGDVIHGSTTNPNTIASDRDKTVTAVFRKEYTLDLAVQGSGSTTPAAGTYTHLSGDEVSISTASGTGYLFSHWEGDTSGSDDPLTVVMDNDKDITAIFLDGYDLTTSVQGQGTVEPSSGLYLPGTRVELAATPAENYTLDHWLINGTTHPNSGPVTTLLMNDDKNVTAVFDLGYALSATVLTGGATGSVEFDPDYPGGTVNGDTLTEIYRANTEVALTAVAEVGYVFDYWEENGIKYNTPSQYTVTMNSSRAVSVAFAEGTMVTTFVSPDESAGYIEYSPNWPGGAESANVRTETYRPGTEITLTAAHRDGYYFDHWEQNGQTVGTDPIYTMTAGTDDVTLTAVFLPGYTLWMNVRSGDGAFDVEPDYPGGTVEGTYRVETYPEDSIVVLNPLPGEGYAFLSYLVWQNEQEVAEIFEPELTLTMQDWPEQTERMEPYNKKVELQFVPGVTLTATVSKINEEVPGAITIAPDVPGGTASETEWTEIFVPSSEAEIFAQPVAGFRFSHWEGDDIQGNTQPLATLVMDAEKAVEAVFTAQRTLKVQKIGEGTVSPSPGSYYYDQDTNVTLSASPAQEWWFDHWSVPGDVNDGSTNAQITLTVDGYKTATAVFKRDFTITVATAGTGSGTVSPAVGSHTYTFLDEVPFTATPVGGSAFDHWEGGLTGVSNPEILTVSGDATVTAYFVPTYPLSVTIQGSGSVAKSPNLQNYPAGTTVTLQATPDSGYEFDSWSGDASGSSETVEVVMDSAKSVTATFSQGERLSMNVQGNGTTTPAPGNHFYSNGQQVTLTATPDTGFGFAQWSCPGDAIDGSTSSQVTITMSTNKTVTAIFTEHTLTTAVSNGQTGDNINPAAGTHTYVHGAVVAIQATEGASSSFHHWEGALSGAVNPTTVVMDGDKSVTAVFDTKRTLSLTKTGQGTLTPAVGAHTYPDGKEVSITATPAEGCVFAGWTGDASGNDNPLLLTMDADKSIDAQFWNLRKLTVSVVGDANVTLDPYFGDPITPGTGEHYFFFGDTVRITLTGGNGWHFGHWEGDASGTSNRTSVKMDDNKWVTAVMKANLHVTKEGPGTVTPAEGNNFLYPPQEIQLTATPDPGCKFKEWLIIPSGTDISEWQVLDEATPVIDFTGPMMAKATFIKTYGLQIDIEGNGSVAIDPEKEAYDEGEVVHLTATPGSDWSFDRWWGDNGIAYPDLDNPVTELTMTQDRHFSAGFIERPGLSDLYMTADLAYLLADIGEQETIESFDRNEITYNTDVVRVYAGNGIPDAAELYALEHVLRNRNLSLARYGGIAHDFVWDAWRTNIAQAEVDLPDVAPEIQRVVAGYMTLGDYKSEGFIDTLVSTHYNTEGLTIAAYDRSQQRYFYYQADTDVDGASNLEEWQYASPDGSLDNLDLFVQYLFDNELPPGHPIRLYFEQMEARNNPPEPVDLFSPELDEVFASIDFESIIPHNTGTLMTPEMVAASTAVFGAGGSACTPYCVDCAEWGNLALSSYCRHCTAGLIAWPRGCPDLRMIEQGEDADLTYMSRALAYVSLDPYTGFVRWSAPGSLLDGARTCCAGFQHVAETTVFNSTIRLHSRIYEDMDLYFLGHHIYKIYHVDVHGNAHETRLPYEMRPEEDYRAVEGDPLDSAVTLGVSWSGKNKHVRWCWSPPSAHPSFSYSDTITFIVGDGPFGAQFGAYRPETKTCSLGSNDGGYVIGAWSPTGWLPHLLGFFNQPESTQNGCVYGAIPFPGYTLGVWENGRTRAGTAYAEKKFHFFFPKQEYILTPDVIVAGEGDPGPGPECPGRVVVEEEKKIGGTLYHGPKRYYPKNGWVRIRPVANPGYRFVRWETAQDVTGAVLGMWGTRIPKVVNGLEEEEIAVRMENDTIITAVFEFAPNPGVSRENGSVTLFSESEEDQALLDRAGFHPEDDELSRWLKTEASPGEIFKLTVSNPAELSACGVELSWAWSHEGAHIAGIQPDSSGIAGVAGDVCYVEARNEYVPVDPPIGILRIRVAGGTKVLKTIVVEYGQVRVFELTALKHKKLQNPSPVAQWLEDATNLIFLLDEYPIGATIKDRYEDPTDVNCPIALTLASLGTFLDNDVEMRDAVGTYDIINDEWNQEYWYFTVFEWDLAEAEDILIVDGIMYHPLLGSTGDCSTADPEGWKDPDGHVFLSAAMAQPGTLAHELGHYIAGLPDMYYCDETQGGCGNTPSNCTCRCPQFNRPRGDHHQGPDGCHCGFKFAPFNPRVPNLNNLMSNAAANGAVLAEQKTAFLAAPEKPE